MIISTKLYKSATRIINNHSIQRTKTNFSLRSCKKQVQLEIMVFRPMRGNWLAALKKGVGGRAAYTTSTAPKMKAYAASADYGRANQQKGKSSKQDFVAVYVAIGMIMLSTGLGLHTASQQLRNSPTVRVKKQRRGTLPEVVEPDHVAGESERFIKQSFFRKLAQVQDRIYPDHHHIPNSVAKET